MLGGGVADGLTEAQRSVPAQMPGPPEPREPWGWHRSLSLAPVPIEGNRPGQVSECQILGFRRGAGSALSRKSLSTRCGGGAQASQSLLGEAPCLRGPEGRVGLLPAPRAKSAPRSVQIMTTNAPQSGWVGRAVGPTLSGPEGHSSRSLSGQKAKRRLPLSPCGGQNPAVKARDPGGYRFFPPPPNDLQTSLWASGLGGPGFVGGGAGGSAKAWLVLKWIPRLCEALQVS